SLSETSVQKAYVNVNNNIRMSEKGEVRHVKSCIFSHMKDASGCKRKRLDVDISPAKVVLSPTRCFMGKSGRPKAAGATKERIISVRAESSVAAAVETISARFGVSSAYLYRQAITEYVARNIGATQLTLQAKPAGQQPQEASVAGAYVVQLEPDAA